MTKAPARWQRRASRARLGAVALLLAGAPATLLALLLPMTREPGWFAATMYARGGWRRTVLVVLAEELGPGGLALVVTALGVAVAMVCWRRAREHAGRELVALAAVASVALVMVVRREPAPPRPLRSATAGSFVFVVLDGVRRDAVNSSDAEVAFATGAPGALPFDAEALRAFEARGYTTVFVGDTAASRDRARALGFEEIRGEHLDARRPRRTGAAMVEAFRDATAAKRPVLLVAVLGGARPPFVVPSPHGLAGYRGRYAFAAETRSNNALLDARDVDAIASLYTGSVAAVTTAAREALAAMAPPRSDVGWAVVGGGPNGAPRVGHPWSEAEAGRVSEPAFAQAPLWWGGSASRLEGARGIVRDVDVMPTWLEGGTRDVPRTGFKGPWRGRSLFRADVGADAATAETDEPRRAFVKARPSAEVPSESPFTAALVASPGFALAYEPSHEGARFTFFPEAPSTDAEQARARTSLEDDFFRWENAFGRRAGLSGVTVFRPAARPSRLLLLVLDEAPLDALESGPLATLTHDAVRYADAWAPSTDPTEAWTATLAGAGPWDWPGTVPVEETAWPRLLAENGEACRAFTIETRGTSRASLAGVPAPPLHAGRAVENVADAPRERALLAFAGRVLGGTTRGTVDDLAAWATAGSDGCLVLRSDAASRDAVARILGETWKRGPDDVLVVMGLPRRRSEDLRVPFAVAMPGPAATDAASRPVSTLDPLGSILALRSVEVPSLYRAPGGPRLGATAKGGLFDDAGRRLTFRKTGPASARGLGTAPGTDPRLRTELEARLNATLARVPTADDASARAGVAPAARIALRWAAGAHDRSVRASLSLLSATSAPSFGAVAPVGLGAEAVGPTKEGLDLAFLAPAGSVVGVDVEVRPPDADLHWSVFVDEAPVTAAYLGPHRLRVPSAKDGLRSTASRRDATVPAGGLADPLGAEAAGFFVTRSLAPLPR